MEHINEDNQPNFSVITWIGFNWNGSPHIMLGIGGKKKTKENILFVKINKCNKELSFTHKQQVAQR